MFETESRQPPGFYDRQGNSIPLDSKGIVSFKELLPQERGALAVSILGCANGVAPWQLEEIRKLMKVGQEVAAYCRLKPAHR